MIGSVSGLIVVGLGAGLAVTYAAPEKILPPPRLTAPRMISATPLSPTSVQIDWSGSEDVDSYVVKVGSDRALIGATSTKVLARGEGRGPTQLTLGDLAATTPGIDRFYRVDAVRGGKVRSSRTARFTLKPGLLARLKVTRTTADGVQARWKKVANARQFDVTVARNKSFTKHATTVRTVGGATSFITRGLAADTRYWMRVRPVNSDQLGTFGKPVAFRTEVSESSFKVGNWNVCSEKCPGYAGRARIMAAFLNDNKLDMFGLQEAGGERVGPTTSAIFSGGSQKFALAEGGARARYIFYRPALFSQISGGSFPIGDGRDTTWGKFTIKKTGRVFYFVDVHLENGKGDDSTRARETDAMVSRMNSINDKGLPIIYAGDFNSGPHRSADSPGAKMRAAGMADSVDLATSPVNEQISTSHSFGTGVLAARAHVDHIFVSDDFAVLAWKQIVRLTGGRYTSPVVSDHNALSAVVALDARIKPLGKPTATTAITESPAK